MGEHLSEARTRTHEKHAALTCPADCRGMGRLHCRVCGVSPPVPAAPGCWSSVAGGWLAWWLRLHPLRSPPSPRAACSFRRHLHHRDVGSTYTDAGLGLPLEASGRHTILNAWWWPRQCCAGFIKVNLSLNNWPKDAEILVSEAGPAGLAGCALSGEVSRRGGVHWRTRIQSQLSSAAHKPFMAQPSPFPLWLSW